MKKIIVTGSNGLLGQKVTALSIQDPEIELIATSVGPNRHNLKDGYRYEELDVLDLDRLNELVARYQPDSIIHTAAMTNVDACEAERTKCYALNVQSEKNLVDVCQRRDIQLIHLSTDFIFDGEDGPYTEEAEPSGVFNVSGKDLMSILEIVERVADHYRLNKSLIKAISAESLNQAAKRPKKTGFILDKAIVELGYSPHSFEEGMAFMDKQLKSLS